MATANAELAARIADCGAEAVDIEAVPTDADGGRLVEMDVAVGVLDLKTPQAVAAAELAVGGVSPWAGRGAVFSMRCHHGCGG